jgi:hypothetical protein
MPVRTLALAQGFVTPGATAVTVYTCPSGRTAILKDVRVWNNSAASVAYVVATGSGAGLCLLQNATLAAGACFGAGVWTVLEPGHTLQLSASVSGVLSYWLSGTELVGVA